jgi:hypothetical protein
MSDETAAWHVVEYERFEIHAAPLPVALRTEAHTAPASASRYTYVGYVCHPGADPAVPSQVVPFHADGEESFASAADALYEAVHVARSIVEGTHPDLTVLPLVTGGV